MLPTHLLWTRCFPGPKPCQKSAEHQPEAKPKPHSVTTITNRAAESMCARFDVYVEMKRAFLALIVVLICTGSVYTFEREAPALPTISEPLAVLESATGWMRMPHGTWVSRENRIPTYLSSDFATFQDFREYGLGLDNFGWLQLREMEVDG